MPPIKAYGYSMTAGLIGRVYVGNGPNGPPSYWDVLPKSGTSIERVEYTPSLPLGVTLIWTETDTESAYWWNPSTSEWVPFGTGSGSPADDDVSSAMYAPLTTGEEPLVFVSDGQGRCVMVPYTP